MKKPEHQIEQISIEALVPYARNSRTHSDAQVAQIAASIREFGFTNPVLIDKDGGIIAGHGRVMGARKLGLAEVPCIRLAHLTETQKRAYIIADNKLALNAGWDDELLAIEFAELADAGFDNLLTGFTQDEIDALTPEQIPEGLTDEDAVPEVQAEPVSKLGDVWLLGKHRVMCGDSTSIDAVEALMDGNAVDMVFTDPPYGISIVSGGGKVGGDGAFGGKRNEKKDKSNVIQSSNFAPVAGDDSIDVAVEAIQVIATLGAKVEIIWGGNHYAASLPNSSCWIVWDKQNTGNFADCELAWTNQTTAVRKFEHMWNGMVKASEHGQKRVHPTQKPVALAAWCFEQYGDKCETVVDLFGGSGSTLIACEQKKKTGYIMELSGSYVDVIVSRWQTFTGKQAVHEATGGTFDAAAAELSVAEVE
jgi:DNA modification methylase